MRRGIMYSDQFYSNLLSDLRRGRKISKFLYAQFKEDPEWWIVLGDVLEDLSKAERDLMWMRYEEKSTKKEMAYHFKVNSEEINETFNEMLEHLGQHINYNSN